MADVPTVSWSESEPTGARAISQGDDRIRELKTQLREVVAVDHNMDSSGQDTDWGYHKAVHLIAQADPTTVADQVVVYCKDSGGGVEELFVKDAAGNVVQLTTAGVLAGVVALTGNQTVAGVKTFSSLPLLPDADPTNDLEPTRKSYVDAATPVIKIGTYTGNGVSPHTITGVGVDLTAGVWMVQIDKIMSGQGSDTATKTSSDTTTYSTLEDANYSNNCILAGAADGFTLGNNAAVNKSACTYRYIVTKVS